MTKRYDTLVFIPAWNEEENLPAVLAELAAQLPETDVLVVDDGSTDGTADIARGKGADVLSFGENRGLRAGIAAGYGYASENGYAFVGRVDADGQHPVDELEKLLQLVKAGDADVAVGSRFATGDGYEAFRYEPSPSRRFGTAVLRRAMHAAGLLVVEVPVHMRERASGESKLRGRRAVELVLTVVGTLFLYGVWRRLRRRRR